MRFASQHHSRAESVKLNSPSALTPIHLRCTAYEERKCCITEAIELRICTGRAGRAFTVRILPRVYSARVVISGRRQGVSGSHPLTRGPRWRCEWFRHDPVELFDTSGAILAGKIGKTFGDKRNHWGFVVFRENPVITRFHDLILMHRHSDADARVG